MKNKEKQTSTLIKDAMALFLITLISGLCLSFVFEVTKAPIAEQKIQKSKAANQAVFITASSFEVDEALTALAKSTALTTLSTDFNGITIDEINRVQDSNKETLGYNITVTTKQSYKDYITLIVGYAKDRTIQGIQITSINETAGLGMNANKPDFIHQFLKKKVEQFEVTKTGVTSEKQIDALSGATITSRAVTNAINAGIAFINKNAADMGGTK